MRAWLRLDVLLAERGLVESRSRAQALVLAGPGTRRRPGRHQGRLERRVPTPRLDVDLGPPFVSRGGDKLSAALAAFAVDPSGERCLDVGASTGGFTDCLLQAGAARGVRGRRRARASCTSACARIRGSRSSMA